jgi:hypothetical protein
MFLLFKNSTTMHRHSFFALLIILALCLACTTERARLAKVKLSMEVKRFEQTLFSIDEQNFDAIVDSMQAEYGEFFQIFTQNIIAVGTRDSADFKVKLMEFLHDSIVRQGYVAAQQTFACTKELNETFTLAFKRMLLHFPSDTPPQIYTYTAGFNQSIILADNVLALGLDKYLGQDYGLYSQLGFYKYMQRNMYPQKLPADAIRYYAGAMFPAPVPTLLHKIIWEGKLLYFTKQLLPDAADSCIFGFSAKQMRSCLDNEAYMWNVLTSNQLLFTRNLREIRDMTDEAPFTLRFSQEAPGRAAVWIGYRIVERYMKHNRDITLAMLMHNDDAQKILDLSRYNPHQ